MAKFLRRIPFIFAVIYCSAGEVIASWMFSEGLLFDISNPGYIVITTGELALIGIDLYVVLQLYMVKRNNPESQGILFRLAFVILLGIDLKLLI
jgi:hypothetical protein